MAKDRIQCCVPFCRRTTKNKFAYDWEWICARHWKAVPLYLRKRKAKLFRRYIRQFGETHPGMFKPGSPKRIAAARLYRLCTRTWARCKAFAIERAAGL